YFIPMTKVMGFHNAVFVTRSLYLLDLPFLFPTFNTTQNNCALGVCYRKMPFFGAEQNDYLIPALHNQM
ncbi:hypothetical protein LIZ76_17815, partial [Caldibacillus sp. 210928-DFI.2.22]|uniref:hypothetical protein n=1 Tax=Caldibacillus sp. 210928-DFI.2.22 TaxID=2883265 RepID=UPI001D0662C2